MTQENNIQINCYEEQKKFFQILESRFSTPGSLETPFYICLIEYSILTPVFDSKTRQSINNCIMKVFSANLRQQTDIFTFADNKFIICAYFRDEKKVMEILSKITNTVKNEFNDEIEIVFSIVNIPMETTDYNHAFNILAKKKNKYRGDSALKFSFDETSTDEYDSMLFEAIHTLLQRMKAHDKYLLKHSLAVAQCVIYFAEELGLPRAGQKNLIIASLVHDVGYLLLDVDRNKQGNLTPEEWMSIKSHPYVAIEYVLKQFPIFNDCLTIIRDHHEYIDGSGYPLGKKSSDISIYSQILSIADTYTAVREDRPHRRAMRFDEIIDLFIKSAGMKWNENLVTMFLATIADYELRENINKSNFQAITNFIDNINQY